MTKKVVIPSILFLLPILYFWPAVFGDQLLSPGDAWAQNLGLRILIGDLLRQGNLPLWNPYLFGGMPLAGNIQAGVFYLPNWIFAIFSPRAAMNIVVISTYHIALIGTYLYARRIELSRVGAILAALIFGFGGFMSAHLGHTNMIATAAWLGWNLLAFEELFRNFRWRWVGLGALSLTMTLLAGAPQISLYSFLVVLAYGFYTLLARVERSQRGRYFMGLSAMLLLSVAISSIQWLPTYELLPFTERKSITFEFFTECSLPYQQIYGMFFPYFFGGGAAPYRLPYCGSCNLTEYGNHVGMLATLLTVVGLSLRIEDRDRNKIRWFWGILAIFAILLSLGQYLPFGSYKIFFKLPVYNLFRVPARHIFELTFAIGILAGIGVTRIREATDRRWLWRSFCLSAGATAMVVISALATISQYASGRLKIELERQGSNILLLPEIYIPLIFCLLGLLALSLYIYRPRKYTGGFLLAVLFLELMSFGRFYEWSTFRLNASEQLRDSATVQYIKDREPDLHSFRILSHSKNPWGDNSALLDYPNNSIARGLQSVNGYDPLRLLRTTEVAGEMGAAGEISDSKVFLPEHQGLNLLNVKYLLAERIRVESDATGIEIDGVKFAKNPLNLKLGPGARSSLAAKSAADEIVLVSAMGGATHLEDATPIVGITLHTREGRKIYRQMQVGRDSAEWAYDRQQELKAIRHSRPPVAESWPADGFHGHRYLSRIRFDRAMIETIELDYLAASADITLTKISLYDRATRSFEFVQNPIYPADRWEKLESFGNVDLYANRHFLPRAWFVNNAVLVPGKEIPEIIKNGKLSDGTPFHPKETAILEQEEWEKRGAKMAGPMDSAKSEVRIVQYEPQRITLESRSAQDGWLVLSEIYYPGWEGAIDGRRAPIDRVDQVLRGIFIPAGEHRIEMVFHSKAIRQAGVWFLLAIGLFGAGGVVARRKTLRIGRP